MTLSLNEADVRQATHIGRIIDAVEAAAREQHAGLVIMPPRANLMKDGTFLRVMPAFMAGSGVMGYKSFHGSLDKGVRYLTVLVRESNGEILALVDASYLTALRTGATSGVATRYLAPEGPATVGLIGSGLEAETNLAAVAEVREVESVRVFSRHPDRRAAFAARMSRAMGLSIESVDSPEAAVAGASIVVVATNTGMNGPVAYRGEWLEEGQHVVSIGATSPFLREIDPEAFAGADIVVFDAEPEQIFEESGDLMVIEGELRERLLKAQQLPELVVTGGVERSSTDITLFKSVGTGAQDLAAAKAVYDVAVERGIGRDIGDLVKRKQF